ncbi:MAG: 30S ribosomal protein S20 [Patescibacteria group bacterium]|nr:30S ribosomal protein S20 [Patescibacteria group bacterium]
MPVIKSAKKKLRKDKKRELANKTLKNLFKKAVKLAEKTPTETNIRKAVRVIDKTAKKNIIHKNKAARIKSKLAKLVVGKKITHKRTDKRRRAPKIKTSKTMAKK